MNLLLFDAVSSSCLGVFLLTRKFRQVLSRLITVHMHVCRSGYANEVKTENTARVSLCHRISACCLLAELKGLLCILQIVGVCGYDFVAQFAFISFFFHSTASQCLELQCGFIYICV